MVRSRNAVQTALVVQSDTILVTNRGEEPIWLQLTAQPSELSTAPFAPAYARARESLRWRFLNTGLQFRGRAGRSSGTQQVGPVTDPVLDSDLLIYALHRIHNDLPQSAETARLII